MLVRFICQQPEASKGILGFYKDVEIDERIYYSLCKKGENKGIIFLLVNNYKTEFRVFHFGFEELSSKNRSSSPPSKDVCVPIFIVGLTDNENHQLEEEEIFQSIKNDSKRKKFFRVLKMILSGKNCGKNYIFMD